MSKGSPIVVVRVPVALLARLDAALAKREQHALVAPWTRTDFILQAIRDKLAHQRRSNRPRKQKKPASP